MTLLVLFNQPRQFTVVAVQGAHSAAASVTLASSLAIGAQQSAHGATASFTERFVATGQATQAPATASVSLAAGSVFAVAASQSSATASATLATPYSLTIAGQQTSHSATALLGNPDAPSVGLGGGPGAMRLLGLTLAQRAAPSAPTPLTVMSSPQTARQTPAHCEAFLFSQTQEEELEEMAMLLLALQ